MNGPPTALARALAGQNDLCNGAHGEAPPPRRPPFFVLVERALRDEGTSYHYLPAARYAEADPALTDVVARAIAGTPTPLLRGASWTTDAPFRESASLIASRRTEGILSVEMGSRPAARRRC